VQRAEKSREQSGAVSRSWKKRAEQSAMREFAEQERSGEQRSQNWALTWSGKTAGSAPMLLLLS